MSTKEKLFKEPDPEGEGGEADGGLPHLPSDITMFVFANLPLPQQARAALVCKNWAVGYAVFLKARQERLKRLKAPRTFLAALLATIRPARELQKIEWNDVPILLSVFGDLQSATLDLSNEEHSGYRSMLHFSGTNVMTLTQCQRPEQFTMKSEIVQDLAGSQTLLLSFDFAVAAPETLPTLLGLLLTLSQEVLPFWGVDDELRHPLRVQVRCVLAFPSGWEDWAPLANVCGAVRLSVSPCCSVVDPWEGPAGAQPQPTAWQAFPEDAYGMFAVISRARNVDECPLSWLHIKAQSWEPAASATCLPRQRPRNVFVASGQRPRTCPDTDAADEPLSMFDQLTMCLLEVAIHDALEEIGHNAVEDDGHNSGGEHDSSGDEDGGESGGDEHGSDSSGDEDCSDSSGDEDASLYGGDSDGDEDGSDSSGDEHGSDSRTVTSGNEEGGDSSRDEE